MLSLPITFSSVIGVFVPVFSRPVWQHVKVLMTGAILAPGKRTVTAILQIMGRSAAPDFQTYHRVLNRAVWSPLTASRLLLRLLVAVFIPPGVAHGFGALTDLTITYLVDQYYNAEDELGVAWDDPDIDADWQLTDPVVSERDRSNPRRGELPPGRTPYFGLRT